KVFNLANEGRIRLLLQSNLSSVHGNGRINKIGVTDKSKVESFIEADSLIPLFGLSPKLGPIADWGLNIDKSAIEVDTFDYSTTVGGFFAIVGISNYPGKLKLILCCYNEAALMAESSFKYVQREQELSFKYTTVNGIN